MPALTPGIPIAAVGWRDVLPVLEAGHLYLCRCQPKVGKSSLALGLVRDLVVQRATPVQVLYLSLDLTVRDLETKLVTALTGVPMEAQRSRALDDAQHQAVARARDAIAGWPVYLRSPLGATVDELVDYMRRQRQATPGQLVIIVDYLECLPPSAVASPLEDHHAALRAFKAAAVSLSVPVIIMAAPGKLEDEPADADAVLELGLLDDDEDDGLREVSLLLVRSATGTTGGTRLLFDPERMLHGEWLPEGMN